MELRNPTPLDDFLFDHGYVVIKNAIEPELLVELNRAIDEIPPLESTAPGMETASAATTHPLPAFNGITASKSVALSNN